MDARYHLAMMIAQGLGGGAQAIWDERNAWRHSLSDPTPPPTSLSRDDHMALALEIARKLDAAGVLKGARH